MRMNGKVAIAVAGAAFLAACSDSPMGPSESTVVPKLPAAPAFVVAGDLVGLNGLPEPGKIKVCKVWDGTPGAPVTINVALTADNGATGNTSVPNASVQLASGTCQTVATTTQPAIGIFDDVSVTEVVAAGVFTLELAQRFDYPQPGGATPAFSNGNSIGFNTVHGSTIVFTNKLVPPPARCTYTKGWYQSKHATDGIARDIINGVDGLSVATQSLIFNTQPNKFATITWDGGNNGLNLYQQFLAALNNLNNNEDAGPTAVDNAIDLVQDNTSYAGGHITINLTQEQISGAIATLSSYNEGQFAGHPHCD